MKSALTDIGKVVMNLIEEYGIAKDNGYVCKPISYALYQTWRIWDEKEKPRETEKSSEEMKEITTDFAIDYLLDDCDDCPENENGECTTQSHCFEVKTNGD